MMNSKKCVRVDSNAGSNVHTNYLNSVELHNSEKDTYQMIVEIVKGSNKKMELEDKNFSKLVKVRKTKRRYPFYYGCFPQTEAGDKDPLDVILFSKKRHKGLDIVEVKIIGVIKTMDDGEVDDKILVVEADDTSSHRRDIRRAFRFLKKYKGRKANMVIDPILYNAQVGSFLTYDANTNFDKTTNFLTIF